MIAIAAIVICTGAIAGCGSSRATSVEAPMMSADASAAALALAGGSAGDPPSSTARPRPPFRVGDRFVGHYNCNQGKTDLILIIEEVIANEDEDNTSRVEVIFEFHFDGKGRSGHGPADGSERMRGTYEPRERRLRLKGEEWIEQPENYRLVSLSGTFSTKDLTYSGSVEGPGCTTFTASSSPATSSSPPTP